MAMLADNPASRLRTCFERHAAAGAEIAQRTRGIYTRVLGASRHLKVGNFAAIHPADLELLFREYDADFFEGLLGRITRSRLQFRLSSRMTSAGGKTTSIRRRGANHDETRYEIAISTTLLFGTFQGEERSVRVTGLPCADRLEALQRIFEHELAHLAEMLCYGDSKCTQPRFQSMARRFFGHSQHTHQLVTPRERAAVEHKVRVGDQVVFRFEGREYRGRVNRITRRATVLVEDPQGRPFSDGKRYRTFYVPLAMLAVPASQ